LLAPNGSSGVRLLLSVDLASGILVFLRGWLLAGNEKAHISKKALNKDQR
jgi:hypothetical protein